MREQKEKLNFKDNVSFNNFACNITIDDITIDNLNQMINLEYFIKESLDSGYEVIEVMRSNGVNEEGYYSYSKQTLVTNEKITDIRREALERAVELIEKKIEDFKDRTPIEELLGYTW